MKKTLSFITVILFFASCQSDKLDDSKVRELFEECMLKENSPTRDTPISLGDEVILATRIIPTNNEKNYSKLADKGLINFEKLGTTFLRSPQYNISLTEKGKKYISKKNGKKNMVKCFLIELNKVVEIHEIPSENIAKVKISLKKTNKTPFMILLNDKLNNDELITQTINFRKTTEGWKLCE